MVRRISILGHMHIHILRLTLSLDWCWISSQIRQKNKTFLKMGPFVSKEYLVFLRWARFFLKGGTVRLKETPFFNGPSFWKMTLRIKFFQNQSQFFKRVFLLKKGTKNVFLKFFLRRYTFKNTFFKSDTQDHLDYSLTFWAGWISPTLRSVWPGTSHALQRCFTSKKKLWYR